jgi:hypothetical protein
MYEPVGMNKHGHTQDAGQPPQVPATPNPAGNKPKETLEVPPALRKSDEELHYASLLAYFKHLVWAIGIFLTAAGVIAGWLFHKDFDQITKDAKSEALIAAKEQAHEASQKEIDTIFKSDTHLQEAIRIMLSSNIDERLAETGTKIAALTNRLNAVALLNTRLSLLVKIDAATQYGLGLADLSRSDLDELITMQNPTNDETTKTMGRLLFLKLRKVYNTADHNGPYIPNSTEVIYKDGTYSHLNVLGHIPNLRDSQGLLTSKVVSNTLSDSLLINVAAGFQKLFDMDSPPAPVETFDFEGLKKWANEHPKEMQETFPLPP